MVNLLRRSVKKFFFRGPYKVRSLNYFLEKKHSKGIHEPEGYLQVLVEETGHTFWYSPPKFLYDTEVQKVMIGGKSRYLESGLFTEPKRILYSMNYAGTLGNSGVIYVPECRTVIKETAIGYESSPINHGVLTAVHTAPAVKLNGVSLSIIKMASEGYYHFLFEALPKLLFCKEYVDNVQHIIISGNDDKAILAWLEYAGAPLNKLRFTNGLTNYHCDQLLFTSDLVTDMQPCPWAVNILKETFVPREIKQPWRWIWASRSDSNSRNLPWEGDLIKQFPKFEKVVFSKLTPNEVVELMSECAVFCGPHGAAFSNIVFQQKGTSVIELFPEEGHFFRPVYSRLADVCALKHIYVTHNFQIRESIAKKIEDALKMLEIE